MSYTPLNPSICPLCGQANQCAITAGLPAESCWCMQASIAPEALQRIPAEQQGKACVCAACGQATDSKQLPKQASPSGAR